MDELKNKASVSGIFHKGNFDFRPLENLAYMRFVECPRFTTLVRHADLSEVTPIHCYNWVTRKQTNFLVPKQDLLIRYTRYGTRFVLLRVINERGISCWLIVSEASRRGFLLHRHILNIFGNIVSKKRCVPQARKQSVRVKRLKHR